MLELTLLILSLAMNAGLLLYARWLIKILQAKEEENTVISETIAEYVSHVKSIHDMEMFYGDQTLTSLMEHGRELVLKIEDLDYVLYEREEETIDE